MWWLHSQGPSKQKSIKNCGERGNWAYPGTAPIFGAPRIKSGNASLFVRIFIGLIATKAYQLVTDLKAACLLQSACTKKFGESLVN